MQLLHSLLISLVVSLVAGKNWITNNADTWLNPSVYYSQSDYHNGYRQDCSGYVSMAWQLGTSAVTWTIPNYAHQIDKSQLQSGDVLLNVDEHVLIFDAWVDGSQTQYYAYEQTPPQTIYHVVQYPYWPGYGEYVPYRLNGMKNDGTFELPTPFNRTARAAVADASQVGKTSLRGKASN